MADQQEVYRDYLAHAHTAKSRGAPINAEAAAAQACLETGFGRHVPPTSYNVLGIKAGSSWKGPVVNAATHEYDPGGNRSDTTAWWRVYRDTSDCFTDYGVIIATRRWFADAAAAADAKPETYLRALEAVYGVDGRVLEPGYFTDPRYVEKAMSIIRAYAPLPVKEPTFEELYPPLEGVTELWIDNALAAGVVKARQVGRKLFVSVEPLETEG